MCAISALLIYRSKCCCCVGREKKTLWIRFKYQNGRRPSNAWNQPSFRYPDTYTVLAITPLFSCLTHFPILLFKTPRTCGAIGSFLKLAWIRHLYTVHTRELEREWLHVKLAQNWIDGNFFLSSALRKTDSVFICSVITGGRIVITCSKNNTVWFRWN